jgi:CBS domain-containing protein
MTQVATIFESRSIHHLPVIDKEGFIQGMISKSDYYKLLDHFTLFGKQSAKLANKKFLGSLLTKEIMSVDIITITPDDTLLTAANIFCENLFHALPVVENGKLVGILSPIDLVNYAFRDNMLELS